EAAGRQPMLVRIPRERILRMGGNPIIPPLYFGAYFDMPAITQVISKAQRVLRFKATLFAEGLKETYRWYQRHRTRQPVDYSFEDRLLSRYQVAAGNCG
ncbi:MAG: NAD-dependent dehydratase, partial [Acidobacteria bacterium]|nr:NAD-dependent dehydratase [Acidobacteriota bacterium]